MNPGILAGSTKFEWPLETQHYHGWMVVPSLLQSCCRTGFCNSMIRIVHEACCRTRVCYQTVFIDQRCARFFMDSRLTAGKRTYTLYEFELNSFL
jgi:hypothetical protein